MISLYLQLHASILVDHPPLHISHLLQQSAPARELHSEKPFQKTSLSGRERTEPFLRGGRGYLRHSDALSLVYDFLHR